MAKLKFLFTFFHKTALHIAIKNQNLEIVQILISNKEIKLGEKYILDFLINVIFK